jgi:hypothetical protein
LKEMRGVAKGKGELIVISCGDFCVDS